jgi:hypothetical protein
LLSTLLNAVRRAEGLNPERGRAYSLMLLGGFVVIALYVWVRFTFIAPVAEPLGGDFVSFYAASKLALSGHAADAWRPDLHAVAEDSLFRGPHGYMAFFYPPPYLLLCTPLALLPYGWALLIWISGTTMASLFALRAALQGRIPFVALAAFPAIWINIGCGQNGALSLAILSLGFLLMPRRPLIAGLVLGLMVIKPQLAIALPFALGGAALAQPRYWKTFLATGGSAVVLCLLSWLAFGNEAWAAFFANSAYARAALQNGLVDPALMQSLFAALRVWHIGVLSASLAQGLLSLSVLTFSASLAFRARLEGPALGALCVAATLLATPFMLDYDLVILALPLGWLCLQGLQSGFRDWEKLVLLALFFLPLVTRRLSQDAHLTVAPFMLAVALILTASRLMPSRTEKHSQSAYS